MSIRITLNDLGNAVKRLNQLTGSPIAYEPGNFHIDSGYGQYKLVRLLPSGGCKNITSYTTKNELYDLVHMFIAGYELASYGT